MPQPTLTTERLLLVPLADRTALGRRAWRRVLASEVEDGPARSSWARG